MLGIVKIFTLSMMSRWLRRAVAPTKTAAGLEEIGLIMSANVIRFFEQVGSPISVMPGEFMAVDDQFNEDRDHMDSGRTRGFNFVEPHIWLALAARELGDQNAIDLPSLSLPVDDLIELMAQGWRITSAGGMLIVDSAFVTAEGAMLEMHVAFPS